MKKFCAAGRADSISALSGVSLSIRVMFQMSILQSHSSHVVSHTFVTGIDKSRNDHVSIVNCHHAGHASRQKFLWFSVTSSIELFSAHKGHFTSTMPRPQHSHSIKPSGEAPKKGCSALTKNPLEEMLKLLYEKPSELCMLQWHPSHAHNPS